LIESDWPDCSNSFLSRKIKINEMQERRGGADPDE
jgi:hypothetical protein